MKKLPYSVARKLMRVGDPIGCRGFRIVSRIIRLFKGGKWDLSHISTVIRDTTMEGSRLEVLEALGGDGMCRNFLSKLYAKAHGKLYWLPMECSEAQRREIIELGAQIIALKIKYDYRSTWLAILAPILVDTKKFNCSEAAWYLLTAVGRLIRRTDDKERAIAPVPGDFPTWSGVEPIEIDMSC